MAAKFNPNDIKAPQFVRNFSGQEVKLTYAGKCLGCGRHCFDGAGDPRGVTGPNHYNEGAEIHTESDGVRAFPACFTCMNDARTYADVMDKAARLSATF